MPPLLALYAKPILEIKLFTFDVLWDQRFILCQSSPLRIVHKKIIYGAENGSSMISLRIPPFGGLFLSMRLLHTFFQTIKTFVRVSPYLIIDRNENEAVRDRIQCIQWIVMLFNNNPMNYLSEKTFSIQKLHKTVVNISKCLPL